MAALNISIPEPLRAFVEAQAEREGFKSAGEYVRAVILEIQARQARREVEAKLIEAIESSPSSPMTREDWEAIGREGMERLDRERART